MRCLAIFALLLSASPAFPAWKETGNSLVRFVCQAYVAGEPIEVIVVEQLSVDTVENSDGSKMITLDGSNFTPSAAGEPEGGIGDKVRFRLKAHTDASIIPSEGSGKTKQELIRDLLSRPTSLNPYEYEGVDEYEGVGYRWDSEFTFVPDDKSMSFHINDLRNWKNAFLRMILIGRTLRCEEPELLPEKVWVED